MSPEIKIIDILIYSNLLIIPLSLFLVLINNKSKRYYFTWLFLSYQISMYFLPALYLFISLKIIRNAPLVLLIFGALFYCLNYILYYLINKVVLYKKPKLDLIDFAHLIPVFFIIFILIKKNLNSIAITSNTALIDIIELQKMIYFSDNSNLLILMRFLYTSFYLFFAVKLLVTILKKHSIIIYSKQIKTFLFALFISKIGVYLCFVLGVIAIIYDSQIIIEIVKFLFLIISLITPVYIIANPKIISVITNFILDSKKYENAQNDDINVFEVLNNLILSNKLFLNSNYSIVNLSADSNISINKIREKIKESGCNNYSEFINSFKINYANSLINEGYLDKFSIESLSKVSGFQSDVTFYRIFKKINGCTPKEYKNKSS